MLTEAILLILSLITYTLIYFYKDKISNKFKLIDIPNVKRKIHSTPTPILGGLIVLIILVYNFSAYYFLNQTNDALLIFILILIFFIVGIIDDINQLSSIFRLTFLFTITYIFLSFSENLIINELNFNFKNLSIKLNSYSIFVTTLSVLLFVNAINLADGINGLSTMLIFCWAAYIKFFLFKDFSMSGFSFLFLIMLIFYHIYNGKYFMGDAGVTMCAILIGLASIYVYNIQNNNSETIYVEELFLLFFIPGLDMFRLFIFRILNKKNPFSADNQHLHHLLINKFKLNYCLFFYFLISFLPLTIYKIFEVNTLYLISIYSVILLILINYNLKNISN
jgi:UDP-GlcNAc:undecaprenyl-phosphate/decaprenyl-phosphate GlcNAc-1-phosphate transferase